MNIANANLLPSQHAAVVGAIDPDAYAAGTQTTGWIDMSQFEAVMFLIMAGALGTAATLDAKVEQATDGAGAGVKDVTDKVIAQLTKVGSDDDKQSVINLFADEMDSKNNFTHVRLSMTVAVATSDAGAVAFGHFPHYGPASDNQAATVAEIVE